MNSVVGAPHVYPDKHSADDLKKSDRRTSGKVTFMSVFIEEFFRRRAWICLQKSPKVSANLGMNRKWWAHWWAHQI
jgi:hypothetical protein